MSAEIGYACPEHGTALLLDGPERLRCESGCTYPVVGGIPRFVASSLYAGSFGLQWNTFRRSQLDSYTGTTISRDRLGRMLGGLEQVAGKEVLEAGCGAGRFTEVLLAAGARVHAADLSSAVVANQENCGGHPAHSVCQADLRRLPWRPGQFDVVICVGVLQHTPSPEESLVALAAQVRPGGLLVVDHYAPGYDTTPPRAALRQALLPLAPEAAMAACSAVVEALWPIHEESWRRRGEPAWGAVRRLLLERSPVVDYQEAYPQLSAGHLREWALLDTHDTVTDTHKHLRSREQLEAALRACGLTGIETALGGNGVEARARKPQGASLPGAPPPRVPAVMLPKAPLPAAADPAQAPPGGPSALERGQARLHAGDTKGGLELLLVAYQAAPRDPGTVRVVAEACLKLGDRQTASAILQAYLRQRPADLAMRRWATELQDGASSPPPPGAAAPSPAPPQTSAQAEPPGTAPAAPTSGPGSVQRGGRPRVLFVALAHSTHTHSWVGLLEGQGFDVRVFGIQGFQPPPTFGVPTATFRPASPDGAYDERGERQQLAALVREWRPDVVHTLGIEPASYIYYLAREEHRLHGIGRWAMTCRGGSDLFLKRFSDQRGNIGVLLRACDVFIADNRESYAFAVELGLPPARASETGPVPGTGGIDVQQLRGFSAAPPSRRSRLILWPKAYECEWSKALPVYEALKLCWAELRPATVLMTAMSGDEAASWFPLLPEEIRSSCVTANRIPRGELLRKMGEARVLLAPSLVDGVPNSLYEAMAVGAMPIVSPLGSIRSVVSEENVLFARNLHPDEIAAALVRAMNDDPLVDATAARNLDLVERIAGREAVRRRVLPLYHRLAANHPPPTPVR